MSSNQPPYDDDRTRALDPVEDERATRPAWEATVDHDRGGRTAGTAPTPPPGARHHDEDPYGRGTPDDRGAPYGRDDRHGPDQRRRRPGKGFALVLLGLVLGVIIAFVVIALGTEPGTSAPGPSDAAMERIEELEAELGEREAQIADLEAQLAEAEAEAGEADEAVAAQRDALEEWSGQLDDRTAAIDERERQVLEREQDVAAREEAADAREQALDEAEEGDGIDVDLPEIDDDEVEGIVEEVLDRIRDLF